MLNSKFSAFDLTQRLAPAWHHRPLLALILNRKIEGQKSPYKDYSHITSNSDKSEIGIQLMEFYLAVMFFYATAGPDIHYQQFHSF
jgi:hypothetical protein